MMKKWTYRLLAGALTLGLAASLTACGQKTENNTQDGAKDLEKITFVLDWTPNTNHTGIYVAMANGYFEDAGLEVEVVQPPEDGAEVLVASGKAQFGVSFQDYIAPGLIGDDPLPITDVAAIIQHNTSGIISRAGEGMDTPKGLEGHKYATWDLPVEKATIQQVMEADGGDFSKVELIPSTVTDEVTALETKSVDAIWVMRAGPVWPATWPVWSASLWTPSGFTTAGRASPVRWRVWTPTTLNLPTLTRCLTSTPL